jgi:phage shock protein PspC (stress-responsive transcriptional regulator)
MVAMNDVPAPTTRARHGRWPGGVCAGLAQRWDVPASRVRLLFLFASLALGLGVLAYVAAWLILPGDDEDGGQRGIVLLAQACGALIGLATLAGAGAVATVFGFGWVVVALAAAVLVGTLAGWTRLGPAWALLPVGALVLPSVAMAAGGVHVEPSTSSVTLAPRTTTQLPRTPIRSGSGC